MNIFVSIQSTYDSIELALMNQEQCIASCHAPKTEASKQLFPLLNDLLAAHHYHLKDLAFIAVNQGPGPFNTLRTVLASVNGISFAYNIPVIGVDALHTMLDEHHNSIYDATFVLLHAFNNDVYCAQRGKYLGDETTCMPARVCMQKLAAYHAEHPEHAVQCIGNAVPLYLNELHACLGAQLVIPEPLPLYSSITGIGKTAVQLQPHHAHVPHAQLMPLYLKNVTYF